MKTFLDSIGLSSYTEKIKNYINTKTNQNQTDLTVHTNNTDIHVTASDKTNWNNATDKINNLEVGGTNLLNNTDIEKNFHHYVSFNYGIREIDTENTYKGKTTLKIKPYIDAEGNVNLSSGAVRYDDIILKSGEYYTYSFMIYSNEEISVTRSSLGHFQTYIDDNSHTAETYYEGDIVPVNTWTKVRITFKTTVDCRFRALFIYFKDKDHVVNICDIKLEKGTVATDWSPAPEDKIEIANVNGLQTIADNSQFTSASLSKKGWYRIAEYSDGDINTVRGSSGNSCEIIIKRLYINNSNEEHRLLLKSKFLNQKFVPISCNSNTLGFTKIRYVYNSTTAYIDVYYDLNSANNNSFAINDGKDSLKKWKAITPTLVAETVESETVSTVFDIPANANPVTDLDLAKYLALTGGTMTGTLTSKASSLIKVLPNPVAVNAGNGGHAQGLTYYNKDDTCFGEIAALGNGGTFSKFYIGFGNNCWQDNQGLDIRPDSIKWKGNEMLHTGNFASKGLTPQRISLAGQLQKTAYRRSVIALCNTSAQNTAATSYSFGKLIMSRSNGLSGNYVYADLYVAGTYDSANGVIASIIEYGSSYIKPCTFTYEGVIYGGVEVFITAAESQYVTFEGYSNFNMFGLDYYDIQNNVALNEEVYNSLSYDNVTYNNGLRFNTKKVFTEDSNASDFDLATVDHTHNYAGSSSAGGAATTALKCTGNSATATAVKNDLDSDTTIKVGYSGVGISADSALNIGAYCVSNGQISLRSMSFNNLKTKLGLGSVGSATQPVYFADGKPVKINRNLYSSRTLEDDGCTLKLKLKSIEPWLMVGSVTMYGNMGSEYIRFRVTTHNNTELSFKYWGGPSGITINSVTFASDGAGGGYIVLKFAKSIADFTIGNVGIYSGYF